MDKPLDVNALCQQWVHSREEDTSTEKVYRPADYAFPPSRGREGFEFNADGTFKRIGIAPTDLSKVAEGTWEIQNENAGRVQIETGDSQNVMAIGSLNYD